MELRQPLTKCRDNDGNMTTGYTPEGYALAITYDAQNRMKTAQYNDGTSHLLRYSYSGNSLLSEVIKEGSTTKYLRSGFLPIQERNGSAITMREYTWGLNLGGGIGGLLNLRQGGADYSYLYDGKGNVSALIDITQAVVASYAYDPFGQLMKKSGTLDQPYSFSTKEAQSGTGQYYYGYRFYDSCSGKWTTRDPLGEAGGMNLYGAVQNDPVNWVDPNGLLTFNWHYIITASAAIESGYGLLESLRLARAVMAEDRNATDKTAPAANIHAMSGILLSGQYQTQTEAISEAREIIQSGNFCSALHAGQDLPGHNGESMANFGLNWSSAKHILKDLYPSWNTFITAYQNTLRILNKRLPR